MVNYKQFLYFSTALLAIIFINQVTEIGLANDAVSLSNNEFINTYNDPVSSSGIYVLSVVIYKILKKLYIKYIKPKRMKKSEPSENQI